MKIVLISLKSWFSALINHLHIFKMYVKTVHQIGCHKLEPNIILHQYDRYYIIEQEKLKDIEGVIRSKYQRRSDNEMVKRKRTKGQTILYTRLRWKLKIEQHKLQRGKIVVLRKCKVLCSTSTNLPFQSTWCYFKFSLVYVSLLFLFFQSNVCHNLSFRLMSACIQFGISNSKMFNIKSRTKSERYTDVHIILDRLVKYKISMRKA